MQLSIMSEKEIERWWVDLKESELDDFIKNWFSEINSDLEVDESPFGGKVVLMNFLASDEFQWKFISRSFELAYDSEHLTTLAAGPVEHLLGFHGGKWIDAIEKESSENDNFAWMMTNVWQNKMTDEVWGRVKKIQESAKP